MFPSACFGTLGVANWGSSDRLITVSGTANVGAATYSFNIRSVTNGQSKHVGQFLSTGY